MASSPTPSSHVSSRGRRKAAVKNTRRRCTTIAATKTSAAQWWVWRMSSPPGTVEERSSVERKARVISAPCSASNGPW